MNSVLRTRNHRYMCPVLCSTVMVFKGGVESLWLFIPCTKEPQVSKSCKILLSSCSCFVAVAHLCQHGVSGNLSLLAWHPLFPELLPRQPIAELHVWRKPSVSSHRFSENVPHGVALGNWKTSLLRSLPYTAVTDRHLTYKYRVTPIPIYLGCLKLPLTSKGRVQ